MARTRISFATCNLFNLNRPGLPIYRDSDGWDLNAYNKRVNWTGSIIKDQPADVWGFQELWHQKALQDVFSASGTLQDYDLLVPPGHEGGHIVCAGAVRKDLLVDEPRWIVNFPPKFTLHSGGDDAQTSGISVAIDSFSRPVLHFKIRPRSRGKTISVY